VLAAGALLDQELVVGQAVDPGTDGLGEVDGVGENQARFEGVG